MIKRRFVVAVEAKLMQHFRRFTLMVIAIAVVLVGATGPASAATSQEPNTSPCMNGGYVKYVDQATGSPYTNQGRCVFVVAEGGTLVPVLPPIHFLAWTTLGSVAPGTCAVAALFDQAQVNYAYPISWLIDGVQVSQSGLTARTTVSVTDVTLFGIGYNLAPVGSTVTLVIGQQRWSMAVPANAEAMGCYYPAPLI